MNVKTRNIIFLSVLCIFLSQPVHSKILPSLISKFTDLPAKESGSSENLFSKLSKNFGQKTHKKMEASPKMASSVVSTSIDSKSSFLPNEERQLGAYENYASFDVNFETTEIQDVISFIEFKMNEITALVEECIQQEYANDVTASVTKIKH